MVDEEQELPSLDLVKRDFTVRRFQRDDLSKVMYINTTCLPENYSPYFFISIHERFPETFLVAEDNEEIVGYIMCRIEIGFSNLKRLELTRKGHIVSIAVLPEYRRKGIGSSLIMDAMKKMADYNATECYLEVRVSNTPAISLYSKLGFTIVKTMRGYYADGEDAYVMARKLPI
ncbi:ribosomal protein S18-alanine N-acetyltransferase [Candidatus Bathyarchaeota archaeon]|nr:ribosomal protein S18-alanine N-acetyltransferase [Candidatus Bathyarchaeota archaeon]